MSKTHRELTEEKVAQTIANMHAEAKAAFPGWEVKVCEWGSGFYIGPPDKGTGYIEVTPRQSKYGGPATLGHEVKVELNRYEYRTGLKSRHAVCKWTSFIAKADEWITLRDELVAREAELKKQAKAGATLSAQVTELLTEEDLNDLKVLQVEADGKRVVLHLQGVRTNYIPGSLTFTRLPEVRELYEAHRAVEDFQRAIEAYQKAIADITKRTWEREQAAEVKSS